MQANALAGRWPFLAPITNSINSFGIQAGQEVDSNNVAGELTW